MPSELPVDKQEVLRGAKLLESHGRHDAAVQLLANAGLVEEAARILSGQRKNQEAAALLLGSLGVRAADAGTLPADKKKLAVMAAILLVKAGQTQEAVEWFVALKEHQRAAEALERAGDKVGAARIQAGAAKRPAVSAPNAPTGVSGGTMTLEAAQRLEAQGKLDLAVEAYVQLRRYAEAGRVAKALGRPGDAGSFYVEVGEVYEAGRCYLEAGDSGRALENFVRVPQDHPQYRAAAQQVARLAEELNHVSLKMDHFLAPFIASGPMDAREVECFYLLAQVYARHDLPENAKEALRKLLQKSPGFRDAQARLQRIDQQTEVTGRDFDRVLKDDASLRGARPTRSVGALPDLPPLPGLPDLPPLPGARLTGSNLGAGRPTSPSPSSEALFQREVGEDVARIAREVNAPARTTSSVSAPTGGTLFSIGASPPAAPPAPAAAPAAAVRTGPPELKVGAVLQERYRLEQKLGAGGTAIVFRATDLELGEEIAIKIFTQPEDEQALGRFKQELILSRQLVHPNIVRLFDIGTFQGCRFISMELLAGSDLASYLRNGPLQPKMGLQILLQACAGLKAAHDRGIVHRDIKPENLFLTNAGQLKVMDFGIAKRALTKGVTVAGMVAGTPEYMSPEQINNFSNVTHLTDLYSLGVVAFQVFTGKLPFQHEELVPLLMMHATQEPPAPRSINPSLPPELEAIILKLMAKLPKDRFPDCGALAEALGKLHAAA